MARLFTLKMTGVFPPERAARLRPELDVIQARVDAKQEEIAMQLAKSFADLLITGESTITTPRGILGS